MATISTLNTPSKNMDTLNLERVDTAVGIKTATLMEAETVTLTPQSEASDCLGSVELGSFSGFPESEPMDSDAAASSGSDDSELGEFTYYMELTGPDSQTVVKAWDGSAGDAATVKTIMFDCPRDRDLLASPLGVLYSPKSREGRGILPTHNSGLEMRRRRPASPSDGREHDGRQHRPLPRRGRRRRRVWARGPRGIDA